MKKQLVLKLVGVIVPVAVAIAGMLYGDVTPVIRDLCEAALPAGAFGPQVDAGAAR